MIDTGVKRSIIANLNSRGATVELHPCTATTEQLLANSPDAVFLANGPGDPGALDYIVATVSAARRQAPGVRDLPRPPAPVPRHWPGDLQAAVRSPRRQPPGQGPRHRPYRDHQPEPRLRGPRARRRCRRSSAIEAVRWDTDFGAAELTHVNLYDRTVEGLRLLEVPGATVQYHPEAGPGPHDSLYLFDRLRRQRSGPRRSTMPRRDDIHKILLLGSGPIVIGQASEFDYSRHPGVPRARPGGHTRSCSSTPIQRRS